MIRILDIAFSLIGLLFGLPLIIVFSVISYLDTGSPIYRQKRVGKDQKPFIIYKFRTMKVGTASVATHEVDFSAVTGLGHFLRRTKLDELPQLWNVLWGDMSIVGPRPCLYSQSELIKARASLGVFGVRPGITGLAQIKGIDMSTPEKLAATDKAMLETLSFKNYLYYIFMTFTGKGRGDRISR